MNLTQAAIDATTDVFSNMVTLSASAGTPFERKAADSDSITGIIHFSGQYSGYAALHMSNQVAEMVSKAFSFLEDHEITEESIKDAIGELTNILAGNIKAFLDPAGSHLKLSLPILVHDEDFVVATLPGATKIAIPFYLDDGDFLVELQLCEN